MNKRILLAYSFSAILAGCGKFGYTSKYVADTHPAVSEKVAGNYYDTAREAIKSTGAVAKEFATAAKEIGKSLGQPLAPPEAVHPRQRMAVTGTGNKFDIIESLPPEQLLPLSKERTKQVQALSYAMRKTADIARIDVAAPPGFNCTQKPDFPDFDLMPPATGDEEPLVDDFSDVREIANKRIEADEKEGKAGAAISENSGSSESTALPSKAPR